MSGARLPFCLTVAAACSLWLFTASAATRKPAPRTAGGRPDLQGMWDNSTLTPLERPAALGDRQSFSPEEATDYETEKRYIERTQARSGDTEDVLTGEINGIWRTPRKLTADLRTSLIVDPANGRIPPLTPEARARVASIVATRKQRFPNGPEDLTLQERCLVWGADPPMLPIADNNILQIVQTPDVVLIAHEMMHDVRVIPLDGRPHLPAAIRVWKGDPRGSWEGDTLVVESTNFTAKTAFAGASADLRVIERFTRTDFDSLRYEFTVDDPASFARPWSATLVMSRTDDRMFEYACHEANYSMPNTLKGARADEKVR